ncbi:MAG TPA: hypothetical protein VFS43_30825 [Polyangiaceae bacterium]|nr:hypothetical protein [Polyangiaceae bacterium]
MRTPNDRSLPPVGTAEVAQKGKPEEVPPGRRENAKGRRRWWWWVAPTSFAIAAVLGSLIVWYRLPTLGNMTYHMSRPENLTGDEALGRALQGLPAATDARIQQFVEALEGLLLITPTSDEVNSADASAAMIQLESDQSEIVKLPVKLPVDHYLFEWRPADRVRSSSYKLNLELSESTERDEKAKRDVSIRINKIDRNDEKRLLVTIALADIADSGGRKSERVCEREFGSNEPILDQGHVNLAPLVDAIAACVLVDHIRITAKSAKEDELKAADQTLGGRFRRALGLAVKGDDREAAKQFGEVYQPILDLGDSNRQRALLSGIERYHTFTKTWREQPGDAEGILNTAVHEFHEAAGGDMTDYRTPRYPLGEYLLVHAETARRLGASRSKLDDFESHLARAFNVMPYSCAPWARAMGLQAASKLAEARSVWESFENTTNLCRPVEVDEARRKANDGGKSIRQKADTRRKELVQARLIATRWLAGEWAKALEGRNLDVRLHSDDPIEWSASHFESAVDHFLVYLRVQNALEVGLVMHGIVGFVEGGLRPIRDAASQLVKDQHDEDLQSKLTVLDDALTNCRTLNTCDQLRNVVVSFLPQVAKLSRERALTLLEEADKKLGQLKATSQRATVGALDKSRSKGDGERAREQRINELRAWILIVRLKLQCLGGHEESTRDGLSSLSSLLNESAQVLKHSVSGGDLAEALSSCALTFASASTKAGGKLLEARRNALMTEAWAWNPPAPVDAFNFEKILWSNDVGVIPEAAPAMVLLRFATIWPAVDTFAGFSVPSRDCVERARKRASRAFIARSFESVRTSIWNCILREDDRKALAGNVGLALTQELLRPASEGFQQPLTCWEILALRKCRPEHAADPVPERCASVAPPTCVVDDERKVYENQLSPPESLAQMYDRVDEAVRRAEEARDHLNDQVTRGLSYLLAHFADAALSTGGLAHPREPAVANPRVRLAALRLVARLRAAPGSLVEQAGPFGRLGSTAFFKLLEATSSDEQLEKMSRLQALVEGDVVRHLAARFGIKFIGADGKQISHLDTVERELQGQVRCWSTNGRTNRRKWLNRFFGHVLLTPELYQIAMPLDRRSGPAVSLVEAYKAWCDWGALEVENDKVLPLVVDEEVLALAWMWQEDSPGRGPSSVLDGDNVIEYVYARALLQQGNASKALKVARRLVDAEGRLAFASAAVMKALPGEALVASLDAKQQLGARSSFLDRSLSVTLGDAYALIAVKGPTKDAGGSFFQAEQFYKAAKDTSVYAKLQLAVTQIELCREKEALAELDGLVRGGCRKARLLTAIAQRARGASDNARKLAPGLGPGEAVDLPDLDRSIQDNCGDGNRSLILGRRTRMLARLILTERSRLAAP